MRIIPVIVRDSRMEDVVRDQPVPRAREGVRDRQVLRASKGIAVVPVLRGTEGNRVQSVHRVFREFPVQGGPEEIQGL